MKKIKEKKEGIIVDITKYMKAKEEEKRKNKLVDSMQFLCCTAILIFIIVWWSIAGFIFHCLGM